MALLVPDVCVRGFPLSASQALVLMQIMDVGWWIFAFVDKVPLVLAVMVADFVAVAFLQAAAHLFDDC
eukprot:11024882-Karenia_brevis.AAC.1